MEKVLDDRWILPMEAARILGVSQRTVTRHIDSGLLRGAHTPFGRVVDSNDVMTKARHRRYRRGATLTLLR